MHIDACAILHSYWLLRSSSNGQFTLSFKSNMRLLLGSGTYIPEQLLVLGNDDLS